MGSKPSKGKRKKSTSKTSGSLGQNHRRGLEGRNKVRFDDDDYVDDPSIGEEVEIIDIDDENYVYPSSWYQHERFHVGNRPKPPSKRESWVLPDDVQHVRDSNAKKDDHRGAKSKRRQSSTKKIVPLSPRDTKPVNQTNNGNNKVGQSQLKPDVIEASASVSMVTKPEERETPEIRNIKEPERVTITEKGQFDFWDSGTSAFTL